MRHLLLSGLILLFSTICHAGGVHESHPYDFLITRDIYAFSEIYQINPESEETYTGSVTKSAFRIRTNYDLSDESGWQATGITRLLSLGSLYNWASDIDVYDNRGYQIGLIQGEIATLEPAKFSIYEYSRSGNYREIGNAYASEGFQRFVILEPNDNPDPIAEMNRDYSNHSWTMSVHNPEKIDDRIVRIFAAFVVDHEDKFE